MFELFSRYYVDVSYQKFCEDLREKTHVFLFRDRQGIVGFSTIFRKPLPDVAPGLFLFSGDTVVREDYWGSRLLQVAFFKFIVASKLRALGQPLYWMLISKGAKTYLMMRKNFAQSFPSSAGATPPVLQRVLERFYRWKFGESFDGKTGVIRFASSLGAVKGNLADPQGELGADPDTAHFLKLNPGYKKGEELACIAEIRIKDFIGHVFKYFLRVKDPRIPILATLSLYLVLGVTVLGFNRNPTQILMTSLTACALEVLFVWLFRKRLEWPLSALITSCGLSILINYSHDYFLLFVPVFFAIASKHVFTFQGRHVFNPAMIGVVFSLLFTHELITIAPAYQWHGFGHMAFFVLIPGLLIFSKSINRGALVLSFLATYTVLTALRAYIMRYHLPFETLFWGTLSSPPFLLFTFFMITDPKTSPQQRGQQIQVGIALAVVDLLFHVVQSYYTFFYAAFVVAGSRFLWSHFNALRRSPAPLQALRDAFWTSRYAFRIATVVGIAGAGMLAYKSVISPTIAMTAQSFQFEPQDIQHAPRFGKIYETLDPRVQHMGKWLLGMGDSVSIGDFEGNGRPGLFFGNPLHESAARGALFRNLGDFKFERVRIPELERRALVPEVHGLPTQGIFVDYDNSGTLDLFVAYAFGPPLLLKNLGQGRFEDVTEKSGLLRYMNSLAATFLDVNRDGLLDLFVTQIIPREHSGYPTPAPLLNLFKLPEPEYSGDRRMLRFMHSSWNQARNGGLNELWLQSSGGKFELQDSAHWGIPETGWSMSVGTADLNHDGFTDLYVANDFGPDDAYLNVEGKRFQRIEGKAFGSIGRDTYKGMNVSIGDLHRDGRYSVYVSNVHHALQAEGSLLWTFSQSKNAPFGLKVRDEATALGVLNESRFGWGGVMADFDNDGWLDIGQANGMVDDSVDKKFERCPDYWYSNEKIARSSPEIHTYIDRWADIRGYCIYGSEYDRIYLNRGVGALPQFIDVSRQVGLNSPGMSRGMAVGDLDGDGRLDLAITHQFRPTSVYRNVAGVGGEVNASVRLRLESRTPDCNRTGLGSQVRLTARTKEGQEFTQLREAQAINGMSAQDEPVLHFGIGSQTQDFRVRVRWCGLEEEEFRGIESGRVLKLVRGTGNAEREQ
jgi:Na+-translocating ferredoxin:NAD+ oxidoreductase RnfD subunit